MANIPPLPLPDPQAHLDNISQELRDHPRWMIHRLRRYERGSIAKVPHCWHDPSRGAANPHNPSNWGTFEQCRAAAVAAGPEFGVGIGLDPSLGIFVPDVDPREGKAPAEQAAIRDSVAYFLALYPTLNETSISDDGTHLFYRGTIPEGAFIKWRGITIYDRGQFIAVTGKNMDATSVIADGAAFLADSNIMAHTETRTRSNAVADFVPIDYGDDEAAAIAAASKYFKGGDLVAQLNDTSSQPGQWFRRLGPMTIAFAAARVPEALALSIMERSAFVTQSTPSRSNERRHKKLHRVWRTQNEWPKAIDIAARFFAPVASTISDHDDSSRLSAFARNPENADWIGRDLLDAFHKRESPQIEQVKKNAPPPMPQGAYSTKVQAMLNEIAVAAPEIFVPDKEGKPTLKLTMPPGISAKFCAQLGEMVTDPQPAYIYSGYLFNLSALLSRKFKDSTALNPTMLQFVVTGRFYTGKSRGANACYSAFESAAAYTDLRPDDTTTRVKVHGNVHVGTHRSVNKLHKDLLDRFGDMGVLTDESGNQIENMLTGKDALATSLRDYLKLSYDAGAWNGELSPPGSMEGHNKGVQIPQHNVNLPMFMTCTNAALKGMRINDLMDGYWTRPIVHYYAEPLNEEPINDEDNLRTEFSTDLARIVRDGLVYSNALDVEYIPKHEDRVVAPPSANAGVPVIDTIKRALNRAELREIADRHLVACEFTHEARDLRKRMQNVCRKIVRTIQLESKGSDWREIIVRLPDNARRVACLLAAVDHMAAHPWVLDEEEHTPKLSGGLPQVSVEHLAYGFRYVLYWLATLLSGIDRGDVAISMDSTELIVLDHIDRFRSRQVYPISVRDLRQNCRYMLDQCIVKTGMRVDASALFETILKRLEADKIIRRADHVVGKYATPHIFILEEHEYWKKPD